MRDGGRSFDLPVGLRFLILTNLHLFTVLHIIFSTIWKQGAKIHWHKIAVLTELPPVNFRSALFLMRRWLSIWDQWPLCIWFWVHDIQIFDQIKVNDFFLCFCVRPFLVSVQTFRIRPLWSCPLPLPLLSHSLFYFCLSLFSALALSKVAVWRELRELKQMEKIVWQQCLCLLVNCISADGCILSLKTFHHQTRFSICSTGRIIHQEVVNYLNSKCWPRWAGTRKQS